MRHSDHPPLDCSALRVVCLRIYGDLDVSTADRTFSDYPFPSSCEANALLIDLSEVTFLDCNGLRQLLTLLKTYQRRGYAVAMICGGNRRVCRLSAILDLARGLPLFDSYDEAMRALQWSSRSTHRFRAGLEMAS